MNKVTGNTYPAKTVLTDAGFAWDKDSKAWFGDDVAKLELDRLTRASYSRANLNACKGIVIEVVS